MDTIDVLKRAREIITFGPLPEGYVEHGEYCPYCALAKAKTDLDEEMGTGLSDLECLWQSVIGWDFDGKEDRPLVEAREAIQKNGILIPPYSRDKTIKIIDMAIRGLKGKT